MSLSNNPLQMLHSLQDLSQLVHKCFSNPQRNKADLVLVWGECMKSRLQKTNF